MNVIGLIKDKNNINSSEDLFGIISPPQYQCKNIDYIIDKFKAINNLTRRYDSEDCDQMNSIISDVNWESDGASDELEKLRKEIEDLREWGQQWKNLAKSLFEDGKVNIDDYLDLP